MAEGGSNTGKWVLIIILVLLAVGLAIYGFMQGTLNLKTILTKEFGINAGIIAGVLFLFFSVVPPFSGALKKAPWITSILLVIAALGSAHALGKTLVYQMPTLQKILFDGNGFSYNFFINTAIFFILIAFIAPMVIKQLKRFADKENSNTFYTIALITAVLIAFQLGTTGVWEKPFANDVEKFLLGDRTGGLFDSHKGWYKSQGETRYGILKLEVKDPAGTTVFPLIVFVVMIIIMRFGMGKYFSGFMQTSETLSWALIIMFSAYTANRGASLTAIIYLVYIGLVVIIHQAIKPFPLFQTLPGLAWGASIYIVDYIAEIVSPLDSPPFFPGGPFGKLFMIGFLAFIVNTGYQGFKYATGNITVCSECGRRCKKEIKKAMSFEDFRSSRQMQRLEASLNQRGAGPDIIDEMIDQKYEEYKRTAGGVKLSCDTDGCPSSCEPVKSLVDVPGALLGGAIKGLILGRRAQRRAAAAAAGAAAGGGGTGTGGTGGGAP